MLHMTVAWSEYKGTKSAFCSSPSLSVHRVVWWREYRGSASVQTHFILSFLSTVLTPLRSANTGELVVLGAAVVYSERLISLVAVNSTPMVILCKTCSVPF